MNQRFLLLAWLALLTPAAIAQTTAPAPTPAPAAAAPSSSPAATPTAAAAPPAAATANPGSKAAGAKTATGRAPASASAATSATASKGGRTNDRIDLDASQITGNRELPKVLYIVPWKRPDLGDLLGKPVNSLLDEVLAPVDRDVFKRENRYFEALQPGKAAAAPATPDSGSSPPPATKP